MFILFLFYPSIASFPTESANQYCSFSEPGKGWPGLRCENFLACSSFGDTKDSLKCGRNGRLAASLHRISRLGSKWDRGKALFAVRTFEKHAIYILSSSPSVVFVPSLPTPPGIKCWIVQRQENWGSGLLACDVTWLKTITCFMFHYASNLRKRPSKLIKKTMKWKSNIYK